MLISHIFGCTRNNVRICKSKVLPRCLENPALNIQTASNTQTEKVKGLIFLIGQITLFRIRIQQGQ